jgi:hypothetical protein
MKNRQISVAGYNLANTGCGDGEGRKDGAKKI